MKKPLLALGIVGFLTALVLGIVWSYVNGHQLPRSGRVEILDEATTWLWPTSIMLMSTENSGPWLSGAILVASAVVNGVVYIILGWIVLVIARRIKSAVATTKPPSLS